MVEIERQYRVIFENMVLGAFFQGADGSLIDVNPAALEMLGLTRDQLKGRPPDDPSWRIIREDNTDLPLDQHPWMAALHSGEQVCDFVAGVYNPLRNGFVWVKINAIPLFPNGSDRPDQVFVTLHDISAQKPVNDIHQSRLHLMEFANSHSLEELLIETLDELEKFTESVIGFYHFYDETEGRVTLKEWSTRTSARCCSVEGKESHHNISHEGVWGDCVRTGEPVIHNDYAALPQRQSLPEGHTPVIRELVVPVKRQGQIVALLGIGNKPHEYTEKDVETAHLFADLAWDIAERKQAAQHHQQATEQFEVLINTSMDGYWVTDAEGRILFANDTICKVYGYSQAELRTKTLRQFDALEDDETMQAHFARIMTDHYDRFETLHYRKDGSVIDVEVSTAFIPDKQIFLAFCRDISERKRIEAELREVEEIFSLFMKYTPVYTFIKQIETDQVRVLQISENYTEILGRPIQEIIGRNMYELFPSELARTMTQDDLKIFREGKFVQLDEELNGRSYTTIKFPIQREGKQGLVAGFTIDITERKQADEKRQNLETQLLHAQKLESLGILAGGIAHDFNNILAAILGNTELALRKLNPESPAIGNLERIEQSAIRAADLAKQMLAYSGKGRFIVEQLDLNRLVEEMAHMLEVSISKKAQLQLNLTRPLSPVLADASQIHQVVMNLVINASEALGDAAGKIIVVTNQRPYTQDDFQDFWLGEKVPAGDYVSLEVTDTGCGIDRKTQVKIFDPFFTTKFTGRGLGMAAVLGIVRSHKGIIKVQSQVGRGTTFTVLLPISTDPSLVVEPAEESHNVAGSGVVLLVDDEEDVRDFGGQMLKELGFEVVFASNGQEALEIYQKRDDFVLVLLDLTMPLLDGEQTFEQLRNINSEVKVVLASGYSEYDLASRFAGKGLAGVLQKPFNMKSLSDVLKGLS